MLEIHPISELRADHKGKVTLLSVNEWRHCKGQMGRPWEAHEEGTADEQLFWLTQGGFTHFVLHDALKREETAIMRGMYGELTDSEKTWLDRKYSAPCSAHEPATEQAVPAPPVDQR